ncbi:hypothetical protein DBO95_21190 [Yersinia pestis]|nr:hypothetical protein DBO95_21190 [Yersinia pestis]
MSRFQLTEQLIYAEINVQEPGTIQHAADQYRQQRDPVLTLETSTSALMVFMRYVIFHYKSVLGSCVVSLARMGRGKPH